MDQNFGTSPFFEEATQVIPLVEIFPENNKDTENKEQE